MALQRERYVQCIRNRGTSSIDFKGVDTRYIALYVSSQPESTYASHVYFHSNQSAERSLRPNRFILKLTSFSLFRAKTHLRSEAKPFLCSRARASKKAMQNIKRGKIPMARPRHFFPETFSGYMWRCVGTANYDEIYVRSLNESRTQYTHQHMVAIAPRTPAHPLALCFNKSANTNSVERSCVVFAADGAAIFFRFGFIINIRIYFCAIPKLHIYVYLFLSLLFHRARYPRGTSILSIYDTRKKVCVHAAAAFIAAVVVGVFSIFNRNTMVSL